MDSLFTRYLNLRSILVASTLLCLPALFSGMLGDDYFHYALLSPAIDIPKADDWSLFGLFSWIDSDPRRNQALMDLGVLPWWTYEGMRYQFWRPLAELSHWIDYQLWRDSPWLMHLHSLVLYLLLGLCLFRLYRRLDLPARTALVALAIFMLDSTHGLTVSWIANRNALMAALFGVLCVDRYVCWREQGKQRDCWLSLLCLSASLFSGEIGISTTCYLGAYSLLLDKAGPRRGLLALWPFMILSIIWFVLYRLGQFGANYSDSNYIDPLESPLTFLLKALERIPVLLFSQFGIVPAEIYGFSPDPVPAYLAIAILFLGLIGFLLLPVVRGSRQAQFWLTGMLFSLLPIAATVPGDRNLTFVGIGASALLGMVIQQWLAGQVFTRTRRTGIGLLFVLHLVLSPLLLPLFSYSPQLWNQLMGLPMARQLPVEDPRESLLSFGVPMPIGMGTLPMRFAEGLPIPDKLWTISTLPYHFTITRLDARTLHVHSDQGMVNDIETHLRDLAEAPLPPHHRISMTDLTLTVMKSNAQGQPTDLRLRFAHDRLASTAILSWDGKGFQRAAVPAVGQSLELKLGASGTLAGTTAAY